MKKIGIVLCGHLRSHRHNFKYLYENLLSKHDCDLYISTWNVMDHNNPSTLSEEKIEEELAIYSDWTKKILIHDAKIFEKSKNRIDRANVGFWENTPDKKHYIIKEASRQEELSYDTDNYWINRISDQWYAVEKGFEAIEEPSSYDLLMRHRLDICLLNLQLHFDKDLVTASPEPYSHLYRMRDHIIYGKPEHMIKFTKFYENSRNAIIKYNNFLAETVLEYCLDTIGPDSKLFVDPNLKEYSNYRILK